MKKILIITGTLKFGGVERLILDTSKEVASQEYKPIVLNLSGDGELQKDLENSGVECLSLNLGNLNKRVLSNIFKVRKIVKNLNPDIIHTHQFASDFYGSLGSMGLDIPLVFHIHNIDLETKIQKILRKIISYFLADALITTTQEKYLELKKKFNPNKIFLLYNATNPQNMALPKEFNRDSFRAGLGAKETNMVVGTIGRLSWEKGFDLLIKAFSEVLKKNPHSLLVIVGDGPQKLELEKLSLELKISKHVSFTGYRKDISSLMSAFDVFVISSRLESFSLTAVEAMLIGTPIVITDRLSSKDLFQSAVLTVPLSINALADGILLLSHNKEMARTLSTRGRELAKEKFTIDNYVINLKKIYQEILAKN
jgi:glycosyltransferase involved in cell wall biosynthesis